MAIDSVSTESILLVFTRTGKTHDLGEDSAVIRSPGRILVVDHTATYILEAHIIHHGMDDLNGHIIGCATELQVCSVHRWGHSVGTRDPLNPYY